MLLGLQEIKTRNSFELRYKQTKILHDNLRLTTHSAKDLRTINQTAMIHLLRNSFPGLVLVMLCLVTQVSGEIRENWFTKFHLCSDTIPNTESVPARSKLACAALCSVRSTCTACSYLPNGTCNLHYGDLTSSTCPAAVTSAAHFQKVKKELGHFSFSVLIFITSFRFRCSSFMEVALAFWSA